MKKTFMKRLMAMVMTVCMVLAMMAVPASALTTYDLELKITEALNSVKTSTGEPSKITVEDDSADVSLNADLTTELVALLSANFEGDAKANKTGLWDFESDTMGRTIEAGLFFYRMADGGAAWQNWIDAFAGDNAITGEDKGSLVTLIKQGKKIKDMTPNKEYELVYEPDATVQLAPGFDVDVANDDPAKGNTYTFTLTLVKTTTGGGGGGGGGGGAAPTEYAITVGAVDNGTAKADATRAEAGKKITVTVTANEGYEVDTVKVAQGTKDVTVTDNGNGTWSFTMPAGAVTVTVTTKAKPVTPVDPYDPSAPGHSTSCPASRFDDVNLNEWYHRAIDYVLSNGLMAGYNTTKFGTNDALSRAMVAQLFYNMEGQPKGDYENKFPDVEENMWYRNAISWAYANGVVSGYGDGLYRPNKDVSREELVQIFCNYAKAKGLSDGQRIADLTSFGDYKDIASWHEVAVSWGVGSGLLGGKGGNIMAPKMSATRAEAAQILMSFCEKIRK